MISPLAYILHWIVNQKIIYLIQHAMEIPVSVEVKSQLGASPQEFLP